jgi:hypothetical protein
MFKKKKKLGTHNICVPGVMETHNILQLFLWQAQECSEILSPIIKPMKTPLRTHNFFTLGSHKKQLLNFMGM